MSYIKSSELSLHAKKNIFGNLYMFAGEESFFIEQNLEFLVKSLKIDDINKETHFGSDIDINELIMSIQTPPFLADKKIVVLKEAHKIKASDQKKIAAALGNGTACILVLLWNEKVKSDTKTSVLFEAINKQGFIVDCKTLYENEVPKWIIEQVSRHGKKIQNDAVSYLIQENGSNLIDLCNEIEKLILFSSDKKEITLPDVETISGHTKQLNLNNIQEAIESKNSGDAVKIVESLLNEGEFPLLILSAIYRTVRRLLEAKSLIGELGLSQQDAARYLRIHPYYANSFFAKLTKFRLEDLRFYIRLVLEADRKMKSTTIPANIVVDELLIKICK